MISTAMAATSSSPFISSASSSEACFRSSASASFEINFHGAKTLANDHGFRPSQQQKHRHQASEIVGDDDVSHRQLSQSKSFSFCSTCATNGGVAAPRGQKMRRSTTLPRQPSVFASDASSLMRGDVDLMDSTVTMFRGAMRLTHGDGSKRAKTGAIAAAAAAAAAGPSSPGGGPTPGGGAANQAFGKRAVESKTKTTVNAVSNAVTKLAKTALSDVDILLCTPGLGAVLDGQGGCVFRVWAPNADGASVIIYDDEGKPAKKVAMERQGAFWAQRVGNLKAGDQYHYVFRHQGVEHSRRDSRARHTVYDSDACIITDAKYDWVPFEGPTLDKLVLYQMHTGAFTGRNGGGKFVDAEAKLDHIKSLGFNAIQLMPVHEFSGEWGYNPRLLFAIHQQYGTPEELRHFVNECHIRGIAVIFELVLNHMATNLNSLWAYDGQNADGDGGLYFDKSYNTGDSRGFAYEQREVREMIIDSALMFLSEYQADGLRFHSVHNMPRDVLEEMTSTLHEKFPGKVLISDVTPENPKVVSGAGFDTTLIHSTYFDMRKHMRGDLDGRKLEKAIGLHYGFTKPTQCVKYFLGAHDHIGDRKDGQFDAMIDGFHRYPIELFGGRAKWEANAAARAWYMVMAVSAGVPMVFMGTEFNHDGWWGVRPEKCLNWELTEDEMGSSMMNLVKAANEMRRESPAILSGTVDVVHYDERHGIIGFWRKSEKEWLFVVANLSNHQWSKEEYEVRVGNCGAGHKYIERFNSQNVEFGGWEGSGNAGKKLKQRNNRISINLPKWSVLIFDPTE